MITESPRSGRNVEFALLGVAAVWGSSYLAAKEVATPDTVFAFLGIRFALAVLALAVMLAPRLRDTTITEVCHGAVLGLILSAIFILETFGVTQTTASNAGLMISLTIVMTPLLEQWAGRSRLPVEFYAATLVAIAGVALLTQADGWVVPRRGDLLILLAAFARAVHVVVIARLSGTRTVDSGRITLMQLMTALITFVATSALIGQPITQVAKSMSTHSWVLTAYLAVVCTVVAFLTQMWAVRHTSPARVSLLLGTEPVWAAMFGILAAGQSPTVIGVAGGVLVLVGTNWGRIVDTRRRPLHSPILLAASRCQQSVKDDVS